MGFCSKKTVIALYNNVRNFSLPPYRISDRWFMGPIRKQEY